MDEANDTERIGLAGWRKRRMLDAVKGDEKKEAILAESFDNILSYSNRVKKTKQDRESHTVKYEMSGGADPMVIDVLDYMYPVTARGIKYGIVTDSVNAESLYEDLKEFLLSEPIRLFVKTCDERYGHGSGNIDIYSMLIEHYVGCWWYAKKAISDPSKIRTTGDIERAVHVWNSRLVFPNDEREILVLYGYNSIMHFIRSHPEFDNVYLTQFATMALVHAINNRRITWLVNAEDFVLDIEKYMRFYGMMDCPTDSIGKVKKVVQLSEKFGRGYVEKWPCNDEAFNPLLRYDDYKKKTETMKMNDNTDIMWNTDKSIKELNRFIERNLDKVQKAVEGREIPVTVKVDDETQLVFDLVKHIETVMKLGVRVYKKETEIDPDAFLEDIRRTLESETVSMYLKWYKEAEGADNDGLEAEAIKYVSTLLCWWPVPKTDVIGRWQKLGLLDCQDTQEKKELCAICMENTAYYLIYKYWSYLKDESFIETLIFPIIAKLIKTDAIQWPVYPENLVIDLEIYRDLDETWEMRKRLRREGMNNTDIETEVVKTFIDKVTSTKDCPTKRMYPDTMRLTDLTKIENPRLYWKYNGMIDNGVFKDEEQDELAVACFEVLRKEVGFYLPDVKELGKKYEILYSYDDTKIDSDLFIGIPGFAYESVIDDIRKGDITEPITDAKAYLDNIMAYFTQESVRKFVNTSIVGGKLFSDVMDEVKLNYLKQKRTSNGIEM